ncbi:oligosaccharide flippase family protein [bacterium]|nr:oligosaccharide flippase family protein [bacterium]
MPLLKDTIFYSIAIWGSRLVTVVTTPVIIAYLTPEDYGYLSLVRVIATFCSTLGLLAIVDQALPRFFIDSKEENERQAFVTTSFAISTAGTIIIIVIIIACTPFVTLVLKDIRYPLIFTSLIALLCFSRSIQYVGANMLKWTFRSPLFMKITLAQTVAAAILTLYGVIWLEWGAKEILITTSAVFFIAGIASLFPIRSFFSVSGFSKSKLKILTLYAWPLLGLNVFAFFMRSLDRIFLAALTTLGAVGVYSVSSFIAGIFETLVGGFFFAWGPHVFSTYGDEGAQKRYAYCFSIISCLCIVAIILLGLWAGPLISLVRPDNAYNEIGVIVPWLISGTGFYYLGGYFALGPAIKKKTYWQFIVFVIAGTGNALLNYSLIPLWGLLGAGIATATSSLIAGILIQIISNRFYYIPYRWKFSFAAILFYTILISSIQNESFVANINGLSIILRGLITIILICTAILPFYRDIISSGILNKRITS